MSATQDDPRGRYERDLMRPGFRADSAQARAVEALQRLYEALTAAPEPPAGLRARLLRLLGRMPEPVQGLYMWGGVGRGKTYLMDNFYESLPFERKQRVHFHRFMRRVHEELKRLAGHKNPLEGVADALAKEARVICFDEFFVTDITDAMILATLLEALFARGVTLVATSNIPPQQLYRDGLQRARFLPAIDLIQRHTLTIEINGDSDHRLRALRQAELYHSPLDDAADKSLLASFHSLVPARGEIRPNQALEVEGRTIEARYVGEDVAWFDFVNLCDGPRSQNDYIELAREYHAVVVSNVPALGWSNDDQARRFINMVDEFYDRRVKLVISAAKPLTTLYEEGRLTFEFQRTVSRLLEMQSVDYLALAHKP
ncbi:cell division protein ZapE [Marinimicrobium sp. ABcell2]|uniref:cell division protein ZapE n=1 Tax=Marinimicrobium sp. ABcell2 TaxID=3069751 RepID=UPI0027B2D2DB|nr:cell division protein ZapE [Marinimicrobium sp. ABcell2]MDQ2078259.1 cell division protein ZapE [Marinimicrobium sp. ABcell2]